MIARLRLSQPKGVVMITSSKVSFSLVAVVMVRDGLEEDEMVEETDVTLVERRRSASAKAVLATWARIALYVPATKRFSSSCQKRELNGRHEGKHAFVEAFLQPAVFQALLFNWFSHIIPPHVSHL